MRQVQPRRNNLGAGGWIWGGNYKIERYLYSLHRITGLGIILFAILHLIETTFFRIQGESVWKATTGFLENPVFEVGLYVVSVAFVFHALNGLRLILQEFGITLGRPRRPVYPFKDALRKKRALTMAFVGIIIVICIIFLVDFIPMGGA
jgi:succinate dehydrogenase / fumarate reductase, cytochrome b subunit